MPCATSTVPMLGCCGEQPECVAVSITAALKVLLPFSVNGQIGPGAYRRKTTIASWSMGGPRTFVLTSPGLDGGEIAFESTGSDGSAAPCFGIRSTNTTVSATETYTETTCDGVFESSTRTTLSMRVSFAEIMSMMAAAAVGLAYPSLASRTRRYTMREGGSIAFNLEGALLAGSRPTAGRGVISGSSGGFWDVNFGYSKFLIAPVGPYCTRTLDGFFSACGPAGVGNGIVEIKPDLGVFLSAETELATQAGQHSAKVFFYPKLCGTDGGLAITDPCCSNPLP